jgi:hypothetical protein
MEGENEIKPNPLVELQEYKIISQLFDKNEDDQTYSINILLPTPESLDKICNQQIVKDVLHFDLKKYKSYFEEQNSKDQEEKKIILNLDKNTSIKSKDLLPHILIFIGGMNSENTLYDFFEGLTVQTEDQCIDNSENYFLYILKYLDFLKKEEKFSIPINQMDSLFSSLDELGINISREDTNVLYRSIKDSFFAMNKNKILVLVAPSHNFWIKSEKSSINEQLYDLKLNNYSNIFYNKNFIQKFLKKIAKHPRCCFGIISSMTYRNLKNCWDGLEKQFTNECPKTVIFIEQNDHEKIQLDPNSKKMSFFRSMRKIIEHLSADKKKELKKKNSVIDDEAENNFLYFNEKNILILESEEDKVAEDNKNNSIFVNVFSEKYLESDEQKKLVIDLEGDKSINYIYKLLETCNDDIREYINKNKISDEYSFA